MNLHTIRNTVLALLAAAVLTACAATTTPEPQPAPAPAAVEPAQPAPQVQAAQPAAAPAPTAAIREEAVTEPVVQTAQKTEAVVADLTRVYFDFDQYALTTEARDTLNLNATILKANPALKVKIEGHCDERGSNQYNIALGERRAQATQNYLVSLGVDGNRLSTVSFGEEMPLEPGHDEAAWAKNRRAEFKPVLK